MSTPVGEGEAADGRTAPALPARWVSGHARLVDAFLAGRNPRTLLAYRADLAHFQAFLGAGSLTDAAGQLLGHGHGEANGLALAYRATLLERGLAPATINRRITAIRSLVRLGRVLGLVPWTLEVPTVPTQAYRDTRGPGLEGFQRMLGAFASQDHPKARRDRAILRLLFDLALRREEVVTLDLAHVDLAAGTVAVLGKGRTQRETLTLPEPTKAAVAAWLAVRGMAPGPLFTNFDRARKGSRLTGTSVYRVVRARAAAVGLKVWPHALRHAGITAGLDLTGGDVRAVQKFSRHRDVRVLERYDDNRTDLAGKVASLVAAGASAATPPATHAPSVPADPSGRRAAGAGPASS